MMSARFCKWHFAGARYYPFSCESLVEIAGSCNFCAEVDEAGMFQVNELVCKTSRVNIESG